MPLLITIQEKIKTIRDIVTRYDTESFAGFFAYFLRHPPNTTEEIELNKFDSKLKDFLYIIGLNAFARQRGIDEFKLDVAVISDLADKLNEIKNSYRFASSGNYTSDAFLHELAFRNHFDNGVLSYVEQDLEKIRAVFSPFEAEVERIFRIDVDSLIEIYKISELITKLRFEQIFAFTHTEEFKIVSAKISSGELTAEEGINALPADIRTDWLKFSSCTYAHLLFSKQDLTHLFPEQKVESFLNNFSCKAEHNAEFNYYTDNNPLESAPIIKLEEDKFLHVCQKQIPVAIYRRLYEQLSSDNTISNKLRRHREKSLEIKVKDVFHRFFGSKETFYYESYYVQNNCEQDLLILRKGTALIVEIKASKLREPFRNIDKAVVRLKDDFKDAVQNGFNQTQRVHDLFYDGDSFDIRDKNKNILYTVDPKKYHTVHSIVVTLERFGALQTDLSLLLKKEVHQQYPWSVYIDDLETFLLSLSTLKKNGNSRFIQFLNERKKLHGRSYAVDELDICGNFLSSPDGFLEKVNQLETFVYFSLQEQSFFDQLYYSGGLQFKENVTAAFGRYFKK